MTVAERVQDIQLRIAKAAEKSGRKPEDITLVGVSKTIDVPKIREAVAAGITQLGENKPQELRDKYPQIEHVSWHQIGHLQTNKVKYIIDKAVLIHSVDSIKLLDEINRQAERVSKVQNVLIQLNISGEESKSGIPVQELDSMLEHAEGLSNVAVKGLMTIPPALADDTELRKLFEICNKLFVDNRAKTYHNISMEYLSMGMTNDFETAIEMGSNMVRVGSGIFGPRKTTI